MGRFFVCLFLSAVLFFASFGVCEEVQPAFFSLMFPQLMPLEPQERTPGEAVAV